ncbi:hypothetical protein V6N13_055433 [Hibiscus sabdariffa]|uniref:Uncharacterized protein n=2 Tax=Hibiscus sabdariffa TaxID=183260 RepID=A0ABR2NTJ0_9ROSI
MGSNCAQRRAEPPQARHEVPNAAQGSQRPAQPLPVGVELLPVESLRARKQKVQACLARFPDEYYDTEWDLIMIDAPRGWFPEAPGRMVTIFLAVVMTRNRK